jgi:periplasmic copper chaperone A
MRLSALFLSFLIATPALAADIKVENAWVRAPAPGQAVVGGFMDITSSGDAKLVSANSPVAGTTELHEMSMKEGVMLMRQVPAIPLPKGQVVKLEPGGLHIMLIDLKKQLKTGDKVPMVLKVQIGKTQQTLKITAEVRDPLAAGMH